MKIAINALFLRAPASGSGQYLVHLLKALAETDQRNEYVLLGPQLLQQESNTPHRFPYQVKPVPVFAGRNENIEKLVWEQFTGPAAAHEAGADLLHVPYFAGPLVPRTPTVVTIHDVIPLRLPLYRAGSRVGAYMRGRSIVPLPIPRYWRQLALAMVWENATFSISAASTSVKTFPSLYGPLLTCSARRAIAGCDCLSRAIPTGSGDHYFPTRAPSPPAWG